ncbi:restriction endonuclease subunit S [Citrobacter sp. R-1.5.2]|uniref:restriction endonuclease subunit S n=1 Tax=Citrobacter sp. R-1.5.2 TaxID=3046183 RepID=UPI002B24B766|nr:restriction endonuclease subunit S [Citrobacter sp. R-1.5.2]MEB2418857.1 restriction endonuclease subunit S [Citrobacter sp. R-1.5.2]
MAKYKTYPEYKDSGVEWLGEIPTHWVVCRLKNLATIKNGQDYKSVQVEDGYPVIGSGGQFTFASKFMYDKPSVLLGRKGTIDKPLYINKPFWTVDTMYYTELNKGVDAKYLYYLALTIQFSRYSTNTALPSMTQEHLSNYKFSIPRVESERRGIIDFLHHETAKIDILIEKQQQLIELLKEKRQAVISHAVTKGLNPDVQMKDSGIEWLGAIPRNWNCVAIKNICKIVNGSTPKSSIEEYWDGDIDWFTPTDLSHKETIQVNDSLRKITNSGFLSCGTTMVPANTVILSSRAPIGSLAITKKSACTNQGCKSLVTFSAQLSKYIYYSLLTFNSPLNNLGRGSTFLELSSDDLGGFKISLPNDDMGEIIKYIDMTILKIDNLIEKQLQQIALLKERRTALISSAVTGKIDVRHWRAPDEQTTAEAEAIL